MISLHVTGTGPDALFLHGFPMDFRMWDPVIDSLGDLRRCMAVDLPGVGRSTPLVDWTIDGMADSVAASLTRPVDLVGLSMGGYAALAFMEMHPDLVRSLVLMDTRAVADTPQARDRRNELAEAVRKNGTSILAEGIEALVADPPSFVLRSLRDMAFDLPRATAAGMLDAMARRPDRSSLLKRIDVPAMVIVGAEDAVTPPSDAAALAEAIPGARCVEIPGAGHVTPLERPHEVVSALRSFWT